MNLSLLTKKIQEICPVEGISEKGDIFFLPEATEQQKQLARNAFDDFILAPDPDPEDYGKFSRTLMATNVFSTKIKGKGNQALSELKAFFVSQLTAISVAEKTIERIATLKVLWNEIVLGLPSPLSSADVAELEAIRASANITSFTFLTDGKMG